MRVLTMLAILLVAAGCSHQQGSPSGTRSGSPISVAAGDRPACAQLFTRLQQVSSAIGASSELIANSVNKTQLSERIAYEQAQLQQAADLMAKGPVPPGLVAADRQLVAALRAFTADFERARAPAALGDFKAAAAAMTDDAVVQRIVNASKTIEDACK